MTKGLATLYTLGWNQNEPGWYTHPVYGSVVIECKITLTRHWWGYPLCGKRADRLGPFHSALQAARALANGHPQA